MPLDANSNGTTVWGNVGLDGAVLSPGGVNLSLGTSGSLPALLTLRTLLSRFTDRMSVLDFGIVGDGSDETAKYVNALTKSIQFGCSLLQPGGMRVCVSGIVAPAGFHLINDGTLFLLPGSNTHLIRVLLGSSTLVEGKGIFDGNSANNINEGGSDPQSAAGGIVTTRIPFTTGPMPTSKIIIRDVTLQNIVNWPIALFSTDTAVVENVKAYNVGNTFQSGDGSTNIHFSDCLVDGSADIAFGFYEGASYSSIHRCTAKNVAAAFGVLNDGVPAAGNWSAQQSHDISITSCKSLLAKSYAIIINNATGTAAANPYNIDVFDNQLEDSGFQGSNNSSGIILGFTSNVRVKRNRINGGGTPGCQWQGIQSNSSNDRIDVEGNWISNGGTVGGVPVAVTAAFGLVLGSTNSRFESNEVWDDNLAAPTMTVGFSGTVGASCTWLLNRARNMKTSTFSTGNPFLSDTAAFTYMDATAALSIFGAFTVHNLAQLIGGATVTNGNVNIVGGVNGAGNNLALAGAAAGSPVGIGTSGPDTDISIKYTVKGAGKHLFAGPIVLSGSSTFPCVTSGNGAPTAVLPNASQYYRLDGTTGTRRYVSNGATWTAVAGE